MKYLLSVLFVASLLVAGCGKKEEPKIKVTGPGGININLDSKGGEINTPDGNIKVGK